MPSDIVSIVVSTGVGVSVLAGILSGVCYVLAHGVQKRRKLRFTSPSSCPVCQRRPSAEGLPTAVCTRCQRRACKGGRGCAKFRAGEGWVCGDCSRPPEPRAALRWIKGLLATIAVDDTTTRRGGAIMDAAASEENESVRERRRKDKEQLRDFIERLVNVMLGENVDDSSVSKLYSDDAYLPATGQSPCSAHAALKQIIERLLKEAINLPSLNRNENSLPPDEADRTYEDLLATAIINKVVSNSQHQPNRPPSSAACSESSRTSNSSRRRRVKEYFFGEETLDDKWKTTDLETSSVSSLEEWIHSDSSIGSKKYVDRVTLTIKQDIEEVYHTDSEHEDDSEYFRTQSSLFTEEEPNWFLQKRQFHGTHSPVPVPMLVPNPTTEAKVLIGDKELDETSDLSDIASDYGETESVPGRPCLLIESKTVIGGKNPVPNNCEDSEDESSADSGVKEVGADSAKSGYDTPNKQSQDRADITVDDDNVEDASILSVYSNTEKEAEYTERYGSLPRTILKTSTPTPPVRTSIQKSTSPLAEYESHQFHHTVDECDSPDRNKEEAIERYSGRYSRREKEKWKHAIEMKNNPYSPENIEKRIKRSSSSVSSLFGPDYYAKLASAPAGDGKSPEVKEIAWPPAQIQETEEQEKSMMVDDVFSTDQEASLKSPDLLSPGVRTDATEMTSDSDLSLVNCYNVEKSEVSKKIKDMSNAHESASESEIQVVTKIEPEFRERPKYLKLHPVSNRKSNPSVSTISYLKRHKSETDLLLEDSFDATPRILGRKKDNTLISRIYQDPHVRSFALSNRSRLPVEATNYKGYHGRPHSCNSDDGYSSRTIRRLFSSEDSLELDVTKKESRYRKKSYKADVSLSSEDELPLESRFVNGNGRRSSKHHIYSSSEDLVSIESDRQPHRRKDSKLISKVYQEPNLRTFAMSIRENDSSIESRKSRKTSCSSEDNVLADVMRKANLDAPKSPVNTRNRSRTVQSSDSDIDELSKKKIVHTILNRLSQSREDLSESRLPGSGYVTDEEINVSVKDLRKVFEKNEGTNRVICSLTGRNLSKQMREELKN